MKPHRRYTAKEKMVLLNTVARAQEQSDQPRSWILAELGLTRSVYYDWLERGREGVLTDRVVVPRPPLPAMPEEIEATVAYAKIRPRDGYRCLAWMIVDEDVVYLAPSTVYRILDKHDLLFRWKRPEPGQGRWVPEATCPNEVWHIDLMYLWLRGRWYFLVTLFDSYSRYIVHWELLLSMRAVEIAETTATALERVHGKKPRIVRDNGSQFYGSFILRQHNWAYQLQCDEHPLWLAFQHAYFIVISEYDPYLPLSITQGNVMNLHLLGRMKVLSYFLQEIPRPNKQISGFQGCLLVTIDWRISLL